MHCVGSKKDTNTQLNCGVWHRQAAEINIILFTGLNDVSSCLLYQSKHDYQQPHQIVSLSLDCSNKTPHHYVLRWVNSLLHNIDRADASMVPWILGLSGSLITVQWLWNNDCLKASVFVSMTWLCGVTSPHSLIINWNQHMWNVAKYSSDIINITVSQLCYMNLISLILALWLAVISMPYTVRFCCVTTML